MYAVIRIRGSVGLREGIKATMEMLRLSKKMHCVLIKEDDCMKGMLQKTKDFITWGEIDDDVLKSLIAKRGRKADDKRLSEKEAQDAFKTIKSGEKSDVVKQVFRLSPPSKGFKESIKQHYPNGELGYRGKEINELLKRMI